MVTWGPFFAGGDSRKVQDQLVNVQDIYSTDGAFAAVKMDGSVVVWGDEEAAISRSATQNFCGKRGSDWRRLEAAILRQKRKLSQI